MLRTRWSALMALMAMLPLAAHAAGRTAAETCITAGYRAGSAAFDMCVARVGGDDPLAALEGGELSGHANKGEHRKAGDPDPLAAVAPARSTVPSGVITVPQARDELPASFNTPSTLPQAPPPSLPPSSPNQGALWPTPPTAPTFPAVVAPTVPMWNFGNQ